MPRAIDWEETVDTSMFSAVQLQPGVIASLTWNGVARWLRTYFVSFPTLITQPMNCPRIETFWSTAAQVCVRRRLALRWQPQWLQWCHARAHVLCAKVGHVGHRAGNDHMGSGRPQFR